MIVAVFWRTEIPISGGVVRIVRTCLFPLKGRAEAFVDCLCALAWVLPVPQAIRLLVICGAKSSTGDGTSVPWIFGSTVVVPSGKIHKGVPFHVVISWIVPLSSLTGYSVAEVRLVGSLVPMGLTAAKIDGSRGSSHLFPACGAF
jgi:hypothetical protein